MANLVFLLSFLLVSVAPRVTGVSNNLSIGVKIFFRNGGKVRWLPGRPDLCQSQKRQSLVLFIVFSNLCLLCSLAPRCHPKPIPGELPSAEDLGNLVNLDAVEMSIGDPVNETQRKMIRKDLDVAIAEFKEREKESSHASDQLPFVTVNNRTNIVAIHSRLLLALEFSVVKSIKKLDIPSDSGAFDEVNLKSSSPLDLI